MGRARDVSVRPDRAADRLTRPPIPAMPRQLDILALEPFFGGVRRAMLEALVRYSRHRWTVLKLPPRRIERRLTAAANWFSEQLSRHWVSRVDLLFTSEAMNLSSLLRLTPQLAAYPSVVYFHDNQFPDLSLRPAGQDDPLDQVNLNTAQSATEVWFNSAYHRQTFFVMARSVVARYPDWPPATRCRGSGRRAGSCSRRST
jgi:hypothetical protein